MHSQRVMLTANPAALPKAGGSLGDSTSTTSRNPCRSSYTPCPELPILATVQLYSLTDLMARLYEGSVAPSGIYL